MNNRTNIGLRTIPLILYGILISYSFFSSKFDFWTPMININENILNWFLAGLFNVVLVFLFLYIRLLIIRFSFEDLNEKIPHSDSWELIQFYITILFTILVIVNGLFFTFFLYGGPIFQQIEILLIMVPFIVDLLFHLKWILF